MYKNILFATDLSESSSSTADKLKFICDKFDAKISLIHVIEPIPAYGYPGYGDLESPFIDHAKEALVKLGEVMNIPKEDQYVEFGSIKGQVLKLAKANNMDLILVGSHGRHGLSRLLGSSANAIVNAAECDVFVLRCGE